jgi:hypothetical protein
MKIFLRMAAVILLLILPTVLTSCDKLGLEEKKTPTKTLVLLCDFSESTKEVRALYLETFTKVLQSINLGDAIVMAKITDASITEPEMPIQESFKTVIRNSITDNSLKKNKEEKEAKEQLEQKKKDMLVKAEQTLIPTGLPEKRILKTDIMSSLLVAEKVFSNFHRDKNVLLICSDMIEDSSRYNFEKAKLNDQKIQEIISKEKNEGRLPNLNGDSVYVIAAGKNNSDTFLTVQKFWLSYFKETGAQLPKEHYGSTLVSFEE